MSWDAINLAKIEARPPVTPSLGGVGLVYPGKRHVFSGPPESAKTLAAYTVALAEIRAGGVVVLIDFEMGPYDARDRLRELGATDDELERLCYIEPDTAATAETMQELLVWKPTLVIVDASAGAYDLQGLDDNKRKDVEQFVAVWIDPFRSRDTATILIDHVVKNADGRGKFAIGSERKIGSADVHLGFETIKPVRRGAEGLYRVMVHKDRLGHLHRPKAAEFVLTSDPDTHALAARFVLETSDQAESDYQWQPTHLMEQVSLLLEQQDEPLSRNRIETTVRGKATYIRQALEALVREGYASESAGRGGARLYDSTKPYRENAPELPGAPGSSQFVPPRPEFVPDESARPRPLVRPPTGTRDESGGGPPRLFADLVPDELSEAEAAAVARHPELFPDGTPAAQVREFLPALLAAEAAEGGA